MHPIFLNNSGFYVFTVSFAISWLHSLKKRKTKAFWKEYDAWRFLKDFKDIIQNADDFGQAIFWLLKIQYDIEQIEELCKGQNASSPTEMIDCGSIYAELGTQLCHRIGFSRRWIKKMMN